MTSKELLAEVTRAYDAAWRVGLAVDESPQVYPAPYLVGDLVVVPGAVVDPSGHATLTPTIYVWPEGDKFGARRSYGEAETTTKSPFVGHGVSHRFLTIDGAIAYGIEGG